MINLKILNIVPYLFIRANSYNFYSSPEKRIVTFQFSTLPQLNFPESNNNPNKLVTTTSSSVDPLVIILSKTTCAINLEI